VKKVVDDPEDCKKEDEPNGGGVLDECPPDFCEGTRYVKEH
jgi:hypothetical protein